MTFLVQILGGLQAVLLAHFVGIWIAMTAAAAIYVAWAVGQAGTPMMQKTTSGPIEPTLTWRRVVNPSAVTAVTSLTVFIGFYIAMTLAWEDFAYYENSFFILGPLKGHNIGLPIYREEGRFFPLGLQEFNIIRHFTDTITGYYLLPIIQLLIAVCILLTLDDALSIAARVALAILALLTPSILMSFSFLIFVERNVLFFLACLMLSVKRFEQTESIVWAVAAVLCAQIMIYYKETAFLLVLGFAAGRLVLRCRNGHHTRWEYERLWDKQSRLDLCLAGLAVLFLVYYFGVMGIHGKMELHRPASTGTGGKIVPKYIRLDFLAWLLVAVVVGRIYLIFRRRATPLPFWDGLALGGVACLLAYLWLGIFAADYLAPVDLIAVLYVGRFAVVSWKRMHSWGKAAALVLAFTVLLQDVFFSAFAVFERKNDLRAVVGIASVVETRYKSRGGNALRLFFPFANPYVIMEFASYLTYRGVPVEGADSEGAGPDSVILATAAIDEDGLCVGYRNFRCHAASGPAPGDLVIVLPADEASLAAASRYRERGELLFFYEPRPCILHKLYPLVGSLQIGAPRYRLKTLPDRWMDGSVTIWK
jgi:hypothetical protein